MAFVKRGDVRKHHLDAERLTIDSIECDMDATFDVLSDVALKATKRIFPLGVSYQLHFCRWTSTAEGRSKLNVLHRMNGANTGPVLRGISHALHGEFGIAIEFEIRRPRLTFLDNFRPLFGGDRKRRRMDEED